MIAFLLKIFEMLFCNNIGRLHASDLLIFDTENWDDVDMQDWDEGGENVEADNTDYVESDYNEAEEADEYEFNPLSEEPSADDEYESTATMEQQRNNTFLEYEQRETPHENWSGSGLYRTDKRMLPFIKSFNLMAWTRIGPSMIIFYNNINILISLFYRDRVFIISKPIGNCDFIHGNTFDVKACIGSNFPNIRCCHNFFLLNMSEFSFNNVPHCSCSLLVIVRDIIDNTHTAGETSNMLLFERGHVNTKLVAVYKNRQIKTDKFKSFKDNFLSECKFKFLNWVVNETLSFLL